MMLPLPEGEGKGEGERALETADSGSFAIGSPNSQSEPIPTQPNDSVNLKASNQAGGLIDLDHAILW